MKVLHATNERNKEYGKIEDAVIKAGASYELFTGDLNQRTTDLASYAFIIKDRYDVALTESVWHQKPDILGLIPAYLPFNKGVNSNLWSVVDNTPKGGSIFFLRDNNYTIDVVERIEVEFEKSDTLRSSFDKIFDAVYVRLIALMPTLISGEYSTTRFTEKDGTVHTREETQDFMESLTHGYDTPLNELKALWNTFHKS